LVRVGDNKKEILKRMVIMLRLWLFIIWNCASVFKFMGEEVAARINNLCVWNL